MYLQADQLVDGSSVSNVDVEPKAQNVLTVLLHTIAFGGGKLAQANRSASRVSAGNGEAGHATTNQVGLSNSQSGVKGAAVMESEANSHYKTCTVRLST